MLSVVPAERDLSKIFASIMGEYVLKGVIPTESEARGLVYSNEMYFSSHTHVFKVENGRSKLFSSCDGTIRMFSVSGSSIYMCTEDRVYMNHFELCIGSLKRTATAIDSTQDLIAIGVGSALEVWHVPKEYAFTLFRMHSRHAGHYRAIRCIKIVDNRTIITASEDCTVRVFDVQGGTSKIVASLSDTPVGLHHDDGQVTVTCINGSVVFLSLETLEFANTRFKATLVSSSSHGDIVALALTGMKDPQADPLPPGQEETSKKGLPANTMIVLLKNREEVYRGEIDCVVEEISLNGYRIAVRSRSLAGIFDTQTGAFSLSIDLPKCLNVSEGQGLLSVGCGDGSVRIYRSTSCISRLFDPNARGSIVHTHIAASTCVAVYETGHVSAFNINDGNCYRSFGALEGLSFYSCSCMTEDGCFLFVSNGTDIHVIEMQRSRLIDTIKTKSPVISTVYYKDHLYSLELDKTVERHNVFSGGTDSVVLESTGTGLSVRNDVVAVSTSKDVVLYDLSLRFLNSFRVLLEGRSRCEMYSRPKPVERVDLDSCHVFCGGQANKIKVIEYSRNRARTLMSNSLVQEIRVSRNKDWENYKEKLYREKTTKYDKKKVIEVLGIVCSERRLFVLSREGVSMYETEDRVFNPIEFDVKATPEFVLESIGLQNYQKALISALQLGSAELAKKVIDSSTDIDFMVKYTPRRYMDVLLEIVFAYLKQDFTNTRMAEVANRIVFHHRISLPGLSDSLHEGTKTVYSLLKKNHYIMESMNKDS